MIEGDQANAIKHCLYRYCINISKVADVSHYDCLYEGTTVEGEGVAVPPSPTVLPRPLAAVTNLQGQGV